ncbi:MAG: hypothetical protein CVU38_06350 [Chloroflexi bacterium HGW-Chloroflexi-1]|nr:MAG: hypothetical protein CVU38_06350 [Chloroflexi bacterium HGW-Chloroflexi-1]
MDHDVLTSLARYGYFVAELLDRPDIERSTVTVWSTSPYTGIAEGEIFFAHGIRLRIREELDFDASLITSCGYEVYRHGERLYWHDDFPHPGVPLLASTFPHHKHIPPDIKHNRVPAAAMSFTRPNLPALLQEIKTLIKDASR